MLIGLITYCLAVASSAIIVTATTPIESDFPAPGFIVGKTRDIVALKVYQKIESPVACEELTFIGSDVIKKPFIIVEGKTMNGRTYWHNGEYYVSSVVANDDNKAAPHGTWIVGHHPGEDSGIAHLKPSSPSYVPVGFESDKSKWNVLNNRSWQTDDGISVKCTRGQVGTHFYSVQHAGSSYSTLLVETRLVDTTIGSSADPPLPAKAPSMITLNLGSSLGSSGTSYSYWHLHTKSWISFRRSEAVCFARGMPVWVKTIARGKSIQPAMLITDEGITNGWALYFRLSDKGSEVERRVEVGTEGLLNGVGIEELSTEEMEVMVKKFDTAIAMSKQGSYLWAWLKVGMNDVEPYILRCEGTSDQLWGEDDSKVGGLSTISVFSYHDSNRRHIMQRSVLDRHTERLVVTRKEIGRLNNRAVGAEGQLFDQPTEELSSSYTYTLNGKHSVKLLGLVSIGPDAISWIQDYLNSHDGILASDVPSCFFYHGGQAIPEPFVYAAEILCVLMGAKPLSMVMLCTFI